MSGSFGGGGDRESCPGIIARHGVACCTDGELIGKVHAWVSERAGVRVDDFPGRSPLPLSSHLSVLYAILHYSDAFLLLFSPIFFFLPCGKEIG